MTLVVRAKAQYVFATFFVEWVMSSVVPDTVTNMAWRLSGRLVQTPFGLSPKTLHAAVMASRTKPGSAHATTLKTGLDRAVNLRPQPAARGTNTISLLRPHDVTSAKIKAAIVGTTLIPIIRLCLPSGQILRLSGATPVHTPAPPKPSPSNPQYEQVTFTFGSIEIETQGNGSAASDDWA